MNKPHPTNSTNNPFSFFFLFFSIPMNDHSRTVSGTEMRSVVNFDPDHLTESAVIFLPSMITSGPLHDVFFPSLRALSTSGHSLFLHCLSQKVRSSVTRRPLSINTLAFSMCADRTESALGEEIHLSVVFQLCESCRLGIPSSFHLQESVRRRGGTLVVSDPLLFRCSFPQG